MQFEPGKESLGLNIANNPMMRGKFRLEGIIEFTLAAAYKDIVTLKNTNPSFENLKEAQKAQIKTPKPNPLATYCILSFFFQK